MFATLKALLVILGLGIPAGLVLVPWTLLTRNMQPLYRTGQWIAHTGLRAAGITFDVQGLENIPDGRACIYMPNHISNLDPPALMPYLPGTPVVMLKRSLMRIPILGIAMRLGRFIPVDRDGNRESAMQAAKTSAEVLQDGLSLLIFIEGTRSRTGRLLPFKRGPFHLAQSAGAPIVPIAIWGTETMMKKGSAAITPGTAHIRFLPAIESKDYPRRNDLLTAVRGSILATLPPNMHPVAIQDKPPEGLALTQNDASAI